MPWALADTDDLPAATARRIASQIIDGYVEQFGFQVASAACQLEHLLSLLESQTRCWKSRETALARLHRLTLEGYAAWLEDTELEEAPAPPALFPPTPEETARLDTRAEGADSPARAVGDASYLQLSQLALWLLVWGEAGNVRRP